VQRLIRPQPHGMHQIDGEAVEELLFRHEPGMN
jgi:hypothetical protein